MHSQANADHRLDAESDRLADSAKRHHNWKRWGPYLSERQWGTVREDYSPDGASWDYFTHDHARSRAYRWGEDGLLGITDRQCRLCFALALWNGQDPILKERLFGLTNSQGNHGEDVKEHYFYLDSTPTHSYLKALYKYPQAAYPYEQLIQRSGQLTQADPEFELDDTGIFNEHRYFDVQAQYAKASPDDILIRITVTNRGPDQASLHVLPTLWFRNTWTWGCTHEGCTLKPHMAHKGNGCVQTDHPSLGRFRWSVDQAPDKTIPPILFTDNHTNVSRVFGGSNPTSYVKDAFHDYVIHGNTDAVNPKQVGTKAAAHYQLELAPGRAATLQMRLSIDNDKPAPKTVFGPKFNRIFKQRTDEADAFYAQRITKDASAQQQQVARQAYAGLLWSKQFYHYIVEDWIDGDPHQPPPPDDRRQGRNRDWAHLYNRDIISMPDKWEYPWYAAWDLAFHCIPLAQVDPEFAKRQLELLLREWYMHPNGQIPAYEWALSDVNPPVHAWACWRVYKMTAPRGSRDRRFLASCFQKLLINFTWWVNRKDPQGQHLFSGGFLGLDNIGLFDRSAPLPTGGHLEQADGTAWMAFYCSTMLSMALELAEQDPTYEDMASKFFEHFVAIVDAMNTLGGTGLWDEDQGFYYDKLNVNGQSIPLRIRSMVGLIPLFAVEVLDEKTIQKLPGFRKRMDWFLNYRHDLAKNISYMETLDSDTDAKHLLAIPSRQRLERVLKYLLDENEFLSPFGVRSLSKVHMDHPYTFDVDGQEHRVEYTPGESTSGLFGGNSNWRGPVWFPVNYLIVEALERYHHYYGDSLQVQCPTGSGNMMNLQQVAAQIASRLAGLFLPDTHGHRPCYGQHPSFGTDPHWKDLVLFHEYFHGDTGQGLGANHQTGWTALVTRFLTSQTANPTDHPA